LDSAIIFEAGIFSTIFSQIMNEQIFNKNVLPLTMLKALNVAWMFRNKIRFKCEQMWLEPTY